MTNTLPVTWHENRITGCIQRAGHITNTTDPDDPCTIDWLDLACLHDIARTWLREQEATGVAPERASTGLTGDSEGSDTGNAPERLCRRRYGAWPNEPTELCPEDCPCTEETPTPLCASCGRPRTPDHDADAPGPTVKHPFTLVCGRIQPDGEIHGSAERRLTIGDQP